MALPNYMMVHKSWIQVPLLYSRDWVLWRVCSTLSQGVQQLDGGANALQQGITQAQQGATA